jgi:hypothetical protein
LIFRNLLQKISGFTQQYCKEAVGGENLPCPGLGILLQSVQQLAAINDGSRMLFGVNLSVTLWLLLQAMIFSNKLVFNMVLRLF